MSTSEAVIGSTNILKVKEEPSEDVSRTNIENESGVVAILEIKKEPMDENDLISAQMIMPNDEILSEITQNNNQPMTPVQFDTRKNESGLNCSKRQEVLDSSKLKRKPIRIRFTSQMKINHLKCQICHRKFRSKQSLCKHLILEHKRCHLCSTPYYANVSMLFAHLTKCAQTNGK